MTFRRTDLRRAKLRNSIAPTLAIGAAAVAGGMLGAALAARLRTAPHPPDSAPGRTHKGDRGDFGDYRVTGRTVTVNKPRDELYAAWRDFANLPRFMENVEKVEPAAGPDGKTAKDGKQWAWTISGPAGLSVRLVTELVQERPGELLAWRSLPESDVETEGRVSFRDAPNGRGTEIETIIAYQPPGGAAGRAVAKLFRRSPDIQCRRDMKRFKMMMETGEIATSANRSTAA